MAIVKRIIAAAAIFSLAIISSAPASANALSVEHSDRHARAASHHDRIARINKSTGVAKRARRCKPKTTSLGSTSKAAATTSSKVPETTSKAADPVTTKAAPVTTKAASKPTTTKAAAPPATTTQASSGGGNSGSGKVGLAWSNGEDDNLHKYVTDKTQFLYTWSASCPATAASLGVNCARMLWGNAANKVASFRSLRNTAGTTHLMGMNEVNEPSQADLTVQQGIDLWNQELRPWGEKGMTLISPAVTSAPSGVTWLKGFFAGCGYNSKGVDDKCGVDILAIHYYGTDATAFEKYVTMFHDTFGLDIWVTEFACENFSGGAQCTKDGVWTFMTSVTTWMNNTDWVKAYFAFGLLHDMWNVNYDNQLMTYNDADPSELGYYFINS